MTAATLALAPLLDDRLVERTGIIVDAASGVTGAGRSATATTHFDTVDENFTAYGLLDHRHTPEIEQNIGAEVAVHPAPRADEPRHPRHVLRPPDGRRPSDRDRCSTRSPTRTRAEPFVAVTAAPPSTKATLGTNTALVTARYDERTGYVLALCAIDNLTKGASGGALQAANVALGLDETAGLPIVADAMMCVPRPRLTACAAPAARSLAARSRRRSLHRRSP